MAGNRERELIEIYKKAHTQIIARCTFGPVDFEQAVQLADNFLTADYQLRRHKFYRARDEYPRVSSLAESMIMNDLQKAECVLSGLHVGNLQGAKETFQEKVESRAKLNLTSPEFRGTTYAYRYLVESLSQQ